MQTPHQCLSPSLSQTKSQSTNDTCCNSTRQCNGTVCVMPSRRAIHTTIVRGAGIIIGKWYRNRVSGRCSGCFTRSCRYCDGIGRALQRSSRIWRSESSRDEILERFACLSTGSRVSRPSSRRRGLRGGHSLHSVWRERGPIIVPISPVVKP